MRADRGIQFGVGNAENDRHGRPGGQTSHEDATRIDSIVRRNLASDASYEGGLTVVTPLILRSEPIPALRSVGTGSLDGINHQKAMLVGSAFIRVPAAKSSTGTGPTLSIPQGQVLNVVVGRRRAADGRQLVLQLHFVCAWPDITVRPGGPDRVAGSLPLLGAR